MTDEQKLRSAARLALYDYGVHGWATPRFLLPRDLRPLSIRDSIAHLRAEGPTESYWLTAGQVASRAVLGSSKLDKEILEALAPTPSALIGSILNAGVDGVGGASLSLGVGALLESAAVQSLSKAFGDAFQPCWEESVPPIRLIDFDPETNVTTSRVAVAVRRDQAHLVRRLDPTSWPNGSDGTFETYMVDEEEPDRVFKPGERPAEPDPTRRLSIGADKSGRMFEHLAFSVDGTTQWDVENILAVTYRVGVEEIRLQYELDQSISSRTAMDSVAGGLDIDRGYCFAHPSLRRWAPESAREEYKQEIRRVVASEDADGGPYWLAVASWLDRVPEDHWVVHASKEIRFTDRTPGNVGLEGAFDVGQLINYLSPAILKMFMDMMVVEGACKSLGA